MRRFINAALVAGIVAAAGSASAQESVTGKPHTDARPLYARLADLPDWTGVWAHDWQADRRNPPQPPRFTSEAAKLSAAFAKARDKGENLQSQAANCVPPGVPRVMTQPYPIEFVFQPGSVYIITETYGQVRRVYTDGRPLPDDPDLWFNGHSIGHWEGKTLVVETNGLSPRNELAPGIHATEQTRIRERIWEDAPGKIVIETSIIDAGLFAEPYATRTSYLRKDDWEMREYICEENNRDAADPFGRPSMKLD